MNTNLLKLLAISTIILFIGCIKENIPIAVTDISLSETNLSMKEGSVQALSATIYPTNASNKSVIWSSNNPTVASVRAGIVRAHKEGTSIITAMSVDSGKSATCLVTVTSDVIHVTEILLDNELLELSEGETAVLTATITPETATNKRILWSSTNTEVASVSKGEVTAITKGETIIEAKAEDGNKIATCLVIVYEKVPENLVLYTDELYRTMCAWNAGGTTDHDDYGIMSAFTNTEYMGGDIVLWGTQNWGIHDYLFNYRKASEKRPNQLWQTFYSIIHSSNKIIDVFSSEGEPDNPISRSALGQAYASRALAYIYLMLYFQDPCNEAGEFNADAPGVPVIFAARDGYSQADMNLHKGRNTLGFVAEQAELDINRALALLDGYARPSKNMIDYQVAQGIASRLYLFTHQWQKAADAAKAARAGYTLMDKSRLHAGFMNVEDHEVLWGFDHTVETQTTYASFFSHMSNDSPGYGGLNQMSKLIDVKLYNSISATDYRKTWFNDSNGDPSAAQQGGRIPHASRKFGFNANWLQDYIYMRAAEMYLTEAEAYARLGKASEAQAVMEELMETRDPLWSTSATLEEISLQRRIELWGEGFRYFDLRRTATGIVRNYEGSNHSADCIWSIPNVPAHSKLWLFQIPDTAIQENPQITDADQNEL